MLLKKLEVETSTVRVNASAFDEIGTLSMSFNDMVDTLNRDQTKD